jgi:hypothetical protein
MSPAARAGVLAAPAAARVALAGVPVARAAPAARAGLVVPAVLAAAPAVLAGPLARSATRSSSPTPCASSPT